MPLGRDRTARLEDAWTGLLALAIALTPTLVAVWRVPGFVTQDGPAHTYNAHILLEALRLGDGSPFAPVYEPSWRPLPNLGGHLALMALLSAMPPRVADRAMTSLGLVGVAAALLWLRVRVAGRAGIVSAALLAASLAISMPWLMGFSNFLLGMTLALVTWGLWWGWRDRLGPWRIAAIGLLLVVGYLGHLVSLGLTVVGLVVLAAASPGDRADRRRRLGRTLIACLPVVPLGVLYAAITAEGGAFAPTWEQSGPFWSPAVWLRRLSWVDPITIGRRDFVPLLPGRDGPWCLVLVPSLWLGLGLAVLIGSALRRPRAGGDRPGSQDGGRRAWAILAALLLLGALVGPDGFGADHGYFLAQRVALVGLACLVPALDLHPGRRSSRIGSAAIAAAVALQSLFVWDYAIESDRRAGAILAAGPEVGRGRRVGTLLIDIRGRYRANPLLHADCLLGAGSGNVIWSNYETRHYYFPVQVRPGLDAPSAYDFERIALLGHPDDADRRARLWSSLLGAHGRSIDVVLCWGRDPALEAITARWAGGPPAFRSGAVSVSRRPDARPPHDASSASASAPTAPAPGPDRPAK